MNLSPLSRGYPRTKLRPRHRPTEQRRRKGGGRGRGRILTDLLLETKVRMRKQGQGVTRMRQREGFRKKVPPSPRLGKRQTPKRPLTFTLENGLTLIAPWEVAKSETTLHFHLGKWLHPYCTLGRDEIRRDLSPSPSPLLPHGKWQNLK
ncbi:hypothetical protein B296_00006411 [Ensete ventricosum]|uniref:Uncharacterized protein n=1 Tax=Ensete ventricosum TaxID=4639 RepID=A0A427AJC1_ENSVE|nr:hypothetical protein B296_00006411 [Ensete ventricosum]